MPEALLLTKELCVAGGLLSKTLQVAHRQFTRGSKKRKKEGEGEKKKTEKDEKGRKKKKVN